MHTVHRLHRAGAAIAAVALSLSGASAALASNTTVDPTTLVPAPPEGYTCSANGAQVYCTATIEADYVNEPWLDLPCGTVYATGTDVRQGKRWYQDGLLVTRRVHEDGEYTWSLSPTGGGTVLTVISHTNWVEQFAIPGDLSSNFGHQEGTDLLVRSPNGSVVWQISGQIHGEDRFSGHFMVDELPPIPITSPAEADLCAAFGT